MESEVAAVPDPAPMDGPGGASAKAEPEMPAGTATEPAPEAATAVEPAPADVEAEVDAEVQAMVEQAEQAGAMDADDDEIGLGEDYDVNDLPPYASDECRKLNTETQKKAARLEQLQKVVAENKERVSIMAEHLKNVDQELLHTQALCDAKDKEIKTEKHLMMLADKETERLVSDIKACDRDCDENQNRLNQARNEMFNSNEQMEQFKMKMNWDQEELDQWALAAKQKEEDHIMLEKYKRADDAKVKNMNVKVERLSHELQKGSEELHKEITETKASQIELDNTAEEFKGLHVERQKSIEQWDEAVRSIQERDQSITQLSERIMEANAREEDRDVLLNTKKQQLQTLEQNSKRLRQDVSKSERLVTRTRENIQAQRQMLKRLQNDGMLVKLDLKKAKEDLKRSNKEIESLEQYAKESDKRLDEAIAALEQAEKDFQQLQNDTDSVKDKADKADEIYALQQGRLKAIRREEAVLKAHLVKEQQNLHALGQRKRHLDVEISGARATARNLAAKITELEQRSLKQQEMLYSVDFQVQGMERKVSRASGKRTHDETVELNKEIEELQGRLDSQKETTKLLETQMKKLKQQLGEAIRHRARVTELRKELAGRIVESKLNNESTQAEINELAKRRQDIMVKHDTQKLDVRKRQVELQKLAADAFEQEEAKCEMELEIAEKAEEIGAMRQVADARVRSRREQIHDVTMQLRTLESRVGKLQAKYQCLAGKLRGSADEEQHSQAYYIIKAAQEREELQQKGDSLNSEIKKKEREIRMLHKTLTHLKGRNDKYRTSFQKVEATGPEARLKGRLEEQHKAVADSIYKKRSYLRESQANFDEWSRNTAELREDLLIINEEAKRKEREAQDLERALAGQGDKLKRARKSVKAGLRSLRKKADPAAQDEEKAQAAVSTKEQYVDAEIAKQRNKVMLNMVQLLLASHPELEQTVVETMKNNSVKFTVKPPSVRSTPRPLSTRASTRASSRGGERPMSVRSNMSAASNASNGSQASVVNLTLGLGK